MLVLNGAKEKKPLVHLAFCADANYVPWFGTTLTSLLLNNPRASLHVHLLAEELPPGSCLVEFVQYGRPEFTLRQCWRPGDLLMWDNRAVIHLAVNDYDGHRRLLHRTTAGRERPYAASQR